MRRMALMVFVLALSLTGCVRKTEDALLVYCGGSMRQPMEEIAKLYEQKYGRRVDLSFGDSGTITLQAEERRAGDGYVVHDPFATIAGKKGLIGRTVKVAVLMPSIGVKPGTKGEREVKDLADLAKPGLKIAIPHATKSTCGQVLAAILKKSNFEEALRKNAVLVSRSSGDLVNALTLGSVDAVVAWDAIIRRDKTLKVVPIAEKYQVDAVTSATGKDYPVERLYVTISVLKSTENASAMEKLLDLAASEEGQAVFRRVGFTPISDVSP